LKEEIKVVHGGYTTINNSSGARVALVIGILWLRWVEAGVVTFTLKTLSVMYAMIRAEPLLHKW
jgi:hypothetical protein